MADDSGDAAAELARMLQGLRRREARRREGAELTYREIAAKTGWSLGIVAQYFSGKSLPPVDRFDMLIRLLGATRAEQGTLASARDWADEQRRGLVAGTSRSPLQRTEIRLLGPVEVIGPRGAAKLAGARQRALISLLALDAGRVVTQEKLVDALWSEAPPRTAIKTLYSHIARVRHSLSAAGMPGLLLTRSTGYTLAVRPDEVDVIRFERKVAQGRRLLAAGKTADAAQHFRDALALWRGEALAGAAAEGRLAAQAGRLSEMRLSTHEDLWEARLRLGEHTAAVAELERLLVDHPFRERVVELLMLALHRCGRRTEALEAYQRLQSRLAAQLGARPGPQLAALHSAVQRQSPQLGLPRGETAAAAPAQLPPRVGHFVGRQADLTLLDGLIDSGREGIGRVGVVCGPAGMGKTALAVQWAHGAAARYPDGQLFLDLRGHDPATAMPVAEALTQLLRALHVPAAEIAAPTDALIGLYRSTLHGRRMLVLLDNAGSAEQVSPLVPPSHGSLLLVTSRSQLAGLALDHAVTSVNLDVLPADAALTLLGRVLGAQRVAAEQAAAADLIDLCGRLPLALRIAAARLATHPPRPIAELATELAGANRLASLAVPGDSRTIRAVFAGAYQALSPGAQRLFRRAGLHPGESFTASLAATVAGVAEAEAQRALDELVAVHLVSEIDHRRYRFHDLIRLYAAEHAEAHKVSRVIDWYLTVADAANRVFDPVRDRAGPIAADPPIDPPFPLEHDAALAFLDAERANLLPAVRLAAAHGRDRAAWQLAYLLTSFHVLRGYRTDHAEICRIGLQAALRLNDAARHAHGGTADPGPEALMRSLLGLSCNAIRRYEEALEHLPRALELTRALGDRRGEAMALNNLALAHTRLGHLDAAADGFAQALALHTADGHAPGIALALNNLGHIHTLMARPDSAAEHLTRALALARQIGNAHLEASSYHSLGEASRAGDDHDGALRYLSSALAIRRRIGERQLEADTLNLIGLTHRDRGEHLAARAHFEQALAISRELGDRHLEAATLTHLLATGDPFEDRDQGDAPPPQRDAPDGPR